MNSASTELTHWGWVTHVCVSKLSILGSDNGLSPGRAGILLILPLGTNFSEILIETNTFSFKKMHLKMSSGKWRHLSRQNWVECIIVGEIYFPLCGHSVTGGFMQVCILSYLIHNSTTRANQWPDRHHLKIIFLAFIVMQYNAMWTLPGWANHDMASFITSNSLILDSNNFYVIDLKNVFTEDVVVHQLCSWRSYWL